VVVHAELIFMAVSVLRLLVWYYVIFLNTFCLAVLLYGLEAVPVSNANLRTLQSAWNVALLNL